MSAIENRKDFFKSSLELEALRKQVIKVVAVPTPPKEIKPTELRGTAIPPGVKKPAVENPFLSLLGQWKVQPKEMKPVHHFRACLDDLKKCSEKGDIDVWNELLRPLSALAKATGIDPANDLRTAVELAIGEMDLLLNYLNKKVIPEREISIEKEQAAREANRLDEADQHAAQVEKFDQLAQWLEGQIMEKTELVLV